MNEITVKSTKKDVIITIPVELLEWSQRNRGDGPFNILDEDKMKEYFEEYFVDFHKREDDIEDISSFERLLDEFFLDALEGDQDWIEHDNDLPYR
jgi:hypothetical protein